MVEIEENLLRSGPPKIQKMTKCSNKCRKGAKSNKIGTKSNKSKTKSYDMEQKAAMRTSLYGHS